MPNEVEIIVKSTDRTGPGFRSAENEGRNFSQRMGGFGKAAGSLLAVGFVAQAGTALVGFFGDVIREAEEAEAVSRSTAQGIRTIGAESWTSAEAVGELSESLSNKTGIDDEVIQSSANMLLTFKNVRNEAGELNNVFDRSVAAAQDLAAKGFGDAESAAVMLGKALNDPIAGISSLTRVGVTFTEEQKNQIRVLTESGDILGAQKIILQEVESQVGGTAEATATASQKMSTMWGNLREEIGSRMLPLFERFVTWVINHMPQIEQAVGGFVTGAVNYIENELIPAFQAIRAWWDTNGPLIKRVFSEVARAFGFMVSDVDHSGSILETLMGIMFQRLKGMALDWAIDLSDRVRSVSNYLPLPLSLAVNTGVGHLRRLQEDGNAQLNRLERTLQIQANTSPARESLQRLWNDYGTRKLTLQAYAQVYGDGPGRPAGGSGGGSAIARARELAAGLPVRLSSSYRSPSHNARVGGSRNSYHMDKANPAGDWGGPTWALDELYRRMKRAGGWRELIWRAPGHYDHVHAARAGGIRGGLTLVGEEGPELVNLPHGSNVSTAGATRAGFGLSIGQVVINLVGVSDPESSARAIRKELLRLGRANGSSLAQLA